MNIGSDVRRLLNSMSKCDLGNILWLLQNKHGMVKVTNDCIYESNNYEIVDPNNQTKFGSTVLMYILALYNDSLILEKEVKILLEAGADPNLQNKAGLTALMLASERGYKNIVRMLLTLGAAPNFQNKAGMTALMLCISEVNSPHKGEIVEILLEAGTNSNIKNAFNYTALMIASQPSKYNVDTYYIVKLLTDAQELYKRFEE